IQSIIDALGPVSQGSLAGAGRGTRTVPFHDGVEYAGNIINRPGPPGTVGFQQPTGVTTVSGIPKESPQPGFTPNAPGAGWGQGGYTLSGQKVAPETNIYQGKPQMFGPAQTPMSGAGMTPGTGFQMQEGVQAIVGPDGNLYPMSTRP